MVFYRTPIQAVPPPPPPAPAAAPPATLSPLIAARQVKAPLAVAAEEPTDSASVSAPGLGIFGSVSLYDIANHIKEILKSSPDPDARLVVLEPSSISFAGVHADSTRVKNLGKWEIDIHVAKESHLEPIRKTIEILPGGEDSA